MMLDPRIRLITLSGVVDLSIERRLQRDLSEAAGDRSRELVIDLRGVTSIDSSVLAVLVHAQNQLQRQARALACVVRPGPVQQLLELTGLRNELLVCSTPEEAAAQLLDERHPLDLA
jgi:anti-anti-sigma factor